MKFILAIFYYITLTEKSTRAKLTDEEKLTLLKSHLRLRGYQVWRHRNCRNDYARAQNFRGMGNNDTDPNLDELSWLGTHFRSIGISSVLIYSDSEADTIEKLFKRFLPDSYVTEGPAYLPETMGVPGYRIWKKEDFLRAYPGATLSAPP